MCYCLKSNILIRGRNGQKKNFGRENDVTANRKKTILKLQYLQNFRSEKFSILGDYFYRRVSSTHQFKKKSARWPRDSLVELAWIDHLICLHVGKWIWFADMLVNGYISKYFDLLCKLMNSICLRVGKFESVSWHVGKPATLIES